MIFHAKLFLPLKAAILDNVVNSNKSSSGTIILCWYFMIEITSRFEVIVFLEIACVRCRKLYD